MINLHSRILKHLLPILLVAFLFKTGVSQKNLDFEKWDINYYATDEALNWVNTSDASSYGAPKVVFKEVDNPSSGKASAKLVTSFWANGIEYGVDTLVGALLQQSTYSKRPKSFEFEYKSFPKNGDQILVGVQLTSTINDSLAIIGEGFFSSSETQVDWKKQEVKIHYYSDLKPTNINIVSLSSANAVITDGSLGYAKIGSELYVDNLKLSTKVDKPKELSYFVNVFPNPTKDFINVESNNPKEQMIKLYSFSGKLLLQQSFSKNIRLNISNFPSGTYIYNVLDVESQQVSASNKFTVSK